MSIITPVILCGGSGTRLWPRSRAARPKPFLPLIKDETLFQQGLRRTADQTLFAPPMVVTGQAHLAHVEAQLCMVRDARILVEPAARNTAAAIALAAINLPRDAVMLICPSDHHIGDTPAFVAAAKSAALLADEGWLVAFGIRAISPETGFGYIKQGEALGSQGFKVARFVEKPAEDVAKSFLMEGGYSWNGGIFAFQAGVFLDELHAHRPDIAQAVRVSVEAGKWEGNHFTPDAEIFTKVESCSIDYAVMEHTSRAAMVPAAMAWSDIGNWQALHEAREHDEQGNSRAGVGAARAELVDCRHVAVESDGPRISVIGLEGVIVVVDGDEVLVTSAAGVQKVGKLDGAVRQ